MEVSVEIRAMSKNKSKRSSTFNVLCLRLVVGSWFLVVGCWFLVLGCWFLVVGCWLS